MTAPALPGAAPDPAPGRNDPARLPPEVASHVVAVDALLDAVRKFVKKDTPTGLMRLNDAMVAARDSTAALRAAIARAVGGDGEPVGPDAKSMIEAIRLIGVALGQDDDWVDFSPALVEFAAERIRSLYTRPAATGDTTDDAVRAAHRAEVERAVREAVEQEREAIAAWHDAEADRITRECAESRRVVRENAAAFAGINTSLEYEEAQAETHRECAAAIRARGAKS